MGLLDDRRRLVLEHTTMRQRWPQARWCCNKDRSVFWWEMDVVIEGNRFPIVIVYPDDYPDSPPEIVVDRSLPVGTPHLIAGRGGPIRGPRLCWNYPGDQGRKRNVWNPATDTAATAAMAAYRWCMAFLVWLSTLDWPVPDALE